MKVGVVASPWIPVPPPAYGGTETVVDNLCRGLTELGHTVHLATVGESTCPVDRSWYFEQGPAPVGDAMAEAVHIRAAYQALEEVDVDVVHDHTMLGAQFLSGSLSPTVPVVTTNHGPFTATARAMYATRPPRVALVAISHAQRAFAPEVSVDAVIHHGIDTDFYRPGTGSGDYAIFIGRMSKDKGPDRAIEVARRAGLRLVLVAKMRETAEIAYFEQHVKPLLGPDVEMAGEASAPVRAELLREAKVLINPICWPEPFGLVMAESLASGTPVVALRNGAAPEIVDHGSTGFLCQDEDELVAGLGRVAEIDRAACRTAALERFSRARMAAEHVALYRRLLEAPSLESLSLATPVLGVAMREESIRRAPADRLSLPEDRQATPVWWTSASNGRG
jgi:glycosyltransferase involved in cell wall biosynthesis